MQMRKLDLAMPSLTLRKASEILLNNDMRRPKSSSVFYNLGQVDRHLGDIEVTCP